jgi:hypothetical protein
VCVSCARVCVAGGRRAIGDTRGCR